MRYALIDRKNIMPKKVKFHLVIVGFGEVVPYKYLTCIEEAVNRGDIESYSIIDIESQKDIIDHRVRLIKLKPKNIYYLPDPRFKGAWADSSDFGPIFQKLIRENNLIKVFISTEAKAHDSYLKYCVENGIDSLVEKPVITPMKNDLFDPSAIEPTMQYLIKRIHEKPAHHSVMTLGRYHAIYNEEIVEPLKVKMTELKAPLTSFHLRTSSGVWNLYKEYENREDHPYKYGYGMLMHGAYHYIDLMAQFLELNKLIFPNDHFSLTLSSFVAYPSDQGGRIPKMFSQNFEDRQPKWAKKSSLMAGYGETDTTTTFCLKSKKTGKVITVGTISLEQTTPSIRSWKDLTTNFYNKNGRVSCTDIEAQLSTLFSIHGRSFKVPVSVNQQVVKIDNHAKVSTRTNASLLKGQEFNTTKIFDNFTNSSSNRELMTAWFKGNENKSLLIFHLPAMRILQAIALSIRKPGYPITCDLF